MGHVSNAGAASLTKHVFYRTGGLDLEARA